MDIWSEAKRSEVMRRIRSKDTKPEIAVRSILHRLGFRFRLHKKDLPGCPDIVLNKYRAAIFVNGCFWHSHYECRQGKLPKTKTEFWADKLEKNISRDKRNIEALETAGWSVLVIWECQITKKSLSDVEDALITFIRAANHRKHAVPRQDGPIGQPR